MEAEKIKNAIKIKNTIKNKKADLLKCETPAAVTAAAEETQSELTPTAPVMPVITDEAVIEFLRKDGNFERIILSNAEICNAVISKYLDELYGAAGVPVVRGYSALSVLPKPKSLADAKKIIDGIF